MTQAKKFGTFAGVYTPSVLTILGVIMYMRMGWIVGNTSTFEFIIVVLFSHIISLTTGLSVSSIATDKKIEAGGIYYMLSRSLGLPIGGAIGLTIFVGTALSIALYLIGFSESFNEVTGLLGNALNDYRITASIALVLITVLAFISTSVAIKTQFFILIFIVLSLVSIFMGEFKPELGVILTETTNTKADLSLVFAIFFPAVTGFTAGVAMSGDLENPKKSIPYGTMLSIFTGLIVYFILGVFLRYSIPEEYLKSDYGILLKFAAWTPLLIAGIWGATVSSALGGILGAPRILQALSIDKITPKFFAKGVGQENEPRNALLFTFVIAEAGILIGELDVIAEIVSMFYLSAYGFINLACFLESWASTDFLPKFKIPKWVSLSGFFFTFIVMAYLNLIAMLVALILIGGVFIYLTRKEIALGSGDVWQSVWSSLIKVALKRIHLKDEHKRNWKPNILLFSGNTSARPHLIDFGRAVAGKNGMISNFDFEENPSAETLFPKTRQIVKNELFEQYGIFSVHQEVQNKYKAIESIAETYGFTGVEPNTILMGWGKNTKDPIWFAQMTQRLKSIDYNILFLDYDKERGFGNRETIDIWWDHFGDSADLTLQLVKLIQKSSEWRKATVRLFVINSDFDIKETLLKKITQLLSNLRLDAEIKVINNYQNESQYTLIESYSSETDFIFVELPEVIQPKEFVRDTNELFKHVGTTLLVGASSHFSEVLSFETKAIEKPIVLEKSNMSENNVIDLDLKGVNKGVVKILTQFDVDFQKGIQELNNTLVQNVFGFHSEFSNLKAKDLKQFVEKQKTDNLIESTNAINSALQQIMKKQLELLSSQRKHVSYNLSIDDISELSTDNRREKRVKKIKRIKLKIGIKPKVKIRFADLIRYHFNYKFLPEFNKALDSVLLNETLLFWNLNNSHNQLEIEDKLNECKKQILNCSRVFVNEVAHSIKLISVNSNLDDWLENASSSKLKKEFKQVANFSNRFKEHRLKLIKSLNTKSLLEEGQDVFDSFFSELEESFKLEIILPLENNLSNISVKPEEMSLVAVKSFKDLIRTSIKHLNTKVNPYSETLSVIPKSEFIRFENEKTTLGTVNFSYLNYFELIKEQNIKQFLIEEAQISEATLLSVQNTFEEALRLLTEEIAKEKPTQKAIKELKADLNLAIHSFKSTLQQYQEQISSLIEKSSALVSERLTIAYLFEHIQEVKTETVKIEADKGLKGGFIWLSDKFINTTHKVSQKVDSIVGKLVEKQKQNTLSENIGDAARYQSYFSVRKMSATTKMKLPFYYRELFESSSYSQSKFFGRELELELAREALINSESGVSGAIVVSGEIQSGKTVFVQALLSDKQGVNHYSFDNQENWTIKKFASEIQAKIIEKAKDSKHQVFVLDNIEHIFRNKNGVKIFSELKQLIHEFSGNHTFILMMNNLLLEYLKEQHQFSSSIFINVQLQKLSLEAIHQSIWSRHSEAKLSFTFNEVEESSLSERIRRRTSKNIYRQSGGNIGQANALWLGAISYKNTFNLNTDLFKNDIEDISKPNWLLVLEKLYVFNGISFSQVKQIEGVEEVLKVLERSGIIYKTEIAYKILPQALKSVKQSLEINGVR